MAERGRKNRAWAQDALKVLGSPPRQPRSPCTPLPPTPANPFPMCRSWDAREAASAARKPAVVRAAHLVGVLTFGTQTGFRKSIWDHSQDAEGRCSISVRESSGCVAVCCVWTRPSRWARRPSRGRVAPVLPGPWALGGYCSKTC